MLCQQIVENERIGHDFRVIRSILSTLRDGARLILAKEMDRVDVLDAAIGQIQEIKDPALRNAVKMIFALDNLKGKDCAELGTEVAQIGTAFGFTF